MITLAMLFWIGYTLSAPTWYWWCWGNSDFHPDYQIWRGMYKQGLEN